MIFFSVVFSWALCSLLPVGVCSTLTVIDTLTCLSVDKVTGKCDSCCTILDVSGKTFAWGSTCGFEDVVVFISFSPKITSVIVIMAYRINLLFFSF